MPLATTRTINSSARGAVSSSVSMTNGVDFPLTTAALICIAALWKRRALSSMRLLTLDLVLRLRREIAGVMAFAQLSFQRSGGAVDHPPALDGRALADFFGPARQVFVFMRLQEFARVVVGVAVEHAVAVPRPDRHIGDGIFVAGDELIVRKLPVEHVELTFHFHCKAVDGVFDLHRSIGIEMS